MTCSIESCDRPVYGRGWCGRHYQRWWKHGDPEFSMLRSSVDLLAYFEAHVMEPSEGCRDWPFTTQRNYPVIYEGADRHHRIHRVTCERWHGPPPEGTEAAHSCGRTICWAGEHLRWATHAENMADMIKHGTTRRKM